MSASDSPAKGVRANRKVLYAIFAFLIVIVIAVTTMVLLNVFNSPAKVVKQAGQQYYTEQFYKQVESLGDKKTDFLKKSHETGILVSLENLQRFAKRGDNEKLQKKLKKVAKKCDAKSTKAKITPNKPYGKQDFAVEAVLKGCDK